MIINVPAYRYRIDIRFSRQEMTTLCQSRRRDAFAAPRKCRIAAAALVWHRSSTGDGGGTVADYG